MKVKGALATGFIIALILIVGISYAAPCVDDFSLENPFWNGHSQLKLKTHPTELLDYMELPVGFSARDTTLLIIGPSKPFNEGEVECIRRFLEDGGLVVLADDFGSGNDLLMKLKVKAKFSALPLRDPLFKYKGSYLPKTIDFKPSPYTVNLSSIALNHATILENLGGEVEVLAYSTIFSYLGAKKSVGPFPVMAEVKLGSGSLVLISDSSIFINSMLNKENNSQFLANLVRGKSVVIDTIHWEASNLIAFKGMLTQIYLVAGRIEVRYILVALLLVAVFKLNFKRGEKRGDWLKEVLRKHPEWDAKLLRELEEERGIYGAG